MKLTQKKYKQKEIQTLDESTKMNASEGKKNE